MSTKGEEQKGMERATEASFTRAGLNHRNSAYDLVVNAEDSM